MEIQIDELLLFVLGCVNVNEFTHRFRRQTIDSNVENRNSFIIRKTNVTINDAAFRMSIKQFRHFCPKNGNEILSIVHRERGMLLLLLPLYKLIILTACNRFVFIVTVKIFKLNLIDDCCCLLYQMNIISFVPLIDFSLSQLNFHIEMHMMDVYSVMQMVLSTQKM